ncbi:hypothetical protein PITC_026560 [Penicillium italicum]|uniref:Uncharacterized protein n=1 Tax=Penicillium italicum TaxID=40296 RepID=A0A0A2KYF5_PENIT|nr:hypothetical protein PITC_026560 [Penicillium italicum]
MASKYPEFEPQGDSLRRWMELADEPDCPIPRTTLTIPDIDPRLWYLSSIPGSLTKEWEYWDRTFGLTVDYLASNQEPLYLLKSAVSVVKLTGELTLWVGRTGPGVIFLDNIKRAPNSATFYMSEFAKAFYESHFPLESLKYVIVTSIVQQETRRFIRDQIYKSSERLEFPPKEPQIWESPSPEFCGILGTPIGKVVAAFVLGAYGQGVKRIPRIVTFHTGEDLCEYNLRFDLEDV